MSAPPYSGFLSFCSPAIPNSPFPRGQSVSPGLPSFHELLEFVLERGEVPPPGSVSLTPSLHPPDLLEHYEGVRAATPTEYLDRKTSLLVSQLQGLEETHLFEADPSLPALRHEVSSDSTEVLHQQLAFSLRLNSPPALQAVLQEGQLNLDEPLSLSPSSPQSDEETADTAIPTHPRLTALGLSALFSQGSPICLRALLLAGASVNSRDGQGRTALHWAVLVRDRNTLRLLLSRGADTGCRDERGDTPLHLCSRVGDRRLLSLLLRQSTSRQGTMDLNNSLEHSPLFEAASLGHFPCVRLLLRAGSSPAIPGPLGRSSLHAACLCGSHETVQLLLRSSDSKTLVSAKDSTGATAMHYAAALGRTDLLQLLQAKGASLYAQDREGHNLVHFLSLCPSPTAPATSLFSEDQRIRPRPDFSPLYHIPSLSGVTPLHVAALTGSLGLVRELLSHKCSVNSFDRHLRSPLSYAAILGRNEIVKLLSAFSPDLLNKPDLSQNSLLHYIAATGNAELTEFFLSHSLSKMFLNHQNGEGRTPLHLAVIHTHLSCIDLLLEETGTDLNVPDSERWSPLHFAISLGSSETVRALMARGAKFDAVHFRAIPSIVLAVERNFIKTLEIVLKYGYSANTPCPNGSPLLHLAVSRSSLPACQLLLSHGAAVDACHLGLTPLDLSLRSQQPDITRLLVSLGGRTRGGTHHIAARLIQQRWRLLLHRKREGQRREFWSQFLRPHLRGYLSRRRFRRVRRIKEQTLFKAARVLQRHWRSVRAARRKHAASYEVLRARLQAEKAAYTLILQKIKEREAEAKQAAARGSTGLRASRNLSRQRPPRPPPTSTSLPPIPSVQSSPCIPKAARPKERPSLPKPSPPPPQMTAYLDQFRSLTDQYQSLKSHLPTQSTDPGSIKSSLQQALNQAILLRSDTDRLALPLLPTDPTRPVYHLRL